MLNIALWVSILNFTAPTFLMEATDDLAEVTEFLEALKLPGEEVGDELLPRPPPDDVVVAL